MFKQESQDPAVHIKGVLHRCTAGVMEGLEAGETQILQGVPVALQAGEDGKVALQSVPRHPDLVLLGAEQKRVDVHRRGNHQHVPHHDVQAVTPRGSVRCVQQVAEARRVRFAPFRADRVERRAWVLVLLCEELVEEHFVVVVVAEVQGGEGGSESHRGVPEQVRCVRGHVWWERG